MREFRRNEKREEMPTVQFVKFPNDHTCGTDPACPTPQAMVADSDWATGKLVDVRLAQSPEAAKLLEPRRGDSRHIRAPFITNSCWLSLTRPRDARRDSVPVTTWEVVGGSELAGAVAERPGGPTFVAVTTWEVVGGSELAGAVLEELGALAGYEAR